MITFDFLACPTPRLPKGWANKIPTCMPWTKFSMMALFSHFINWIILHDIQVLLQINITCHDYLVQENFLKFASHYYHWMKFPVHVESILTLGYFYALLYDVTRLFYRIGYPFDHYWSIPGMWVANHDNLGTSSLTILVAHVDLVCWSLFVLEYHFVPKTFSSFTLYAKAFLSSNRSLWDNTKLTWKQSWLHWTIDINGKCLYKHTTATIQMVQCKPIVQYEFHTQCQ